MHIDGPAHPGPRKPFTRVGGFIRDYSLDHLPTLINVLTGDLGVIGPRPMEPEYVDLQDPAWQRYFQTRPGLFNYAVLKLGRTFGPSGSGNLSLKRELELEYIQQQSLSQDFRLLTRYVRAHILSKGNIKARGEPDPALQDRLERVSENQGNENS
jgi:lipopolysaccharide/colanic/teichoic acid biosynthesis glycosyltransferase